MLFITITCNIRKLGQGSLLVWCSILCQIKDRPIRLPLQSELMRLNYWCDTSLAV